VLIAKLDKVGDEEPLSGEKLSMVLSLYRCVPCWGGGGAREGEGRWVLHPG
jgi:hypothetical protein